MKTNLKSPIVDLVASIDKLGALISRSQNVIVLQPEKPDTDSLGSALALEDILGELGKKVAMYCQDPIPTYIRFMDGWDRVVDKFPAQFDLTILVDTGGPQMLSRTLEKHSKPLTAKPFIIIDHHKTREPMPFETIDVVDPLAAATGELLVSICRQLNWPIPPAAAKTIAPSILADTLGLSTPTTTANTVEALAEAVRRGADLYKLRRAREILDALEPELVALKADLLKRIQYHHEGKVATVVITPEELKQYAELHDPADLVNQEMRNIKGVEVAACIRNYASSLHGNKIKISMRANTPVAAKAAQHFGGGGHDQAAGCTIEGRSVQAVQDELVSILGKLINEHAINQQSN
jgi:bifunctional oligoribonuclease and PAP phosphatase NrnA